MKICHRVRERNFPSVLPGGLVGYFLPMPSEWKCCWGFFIIIILIRKPKWKLLFQVLLTQLKHFSWPIWKHFFLGHFFINLSASDTTLSQKSDVSCSSILFSFASSFPYILCLDLIWEDAIGCHPYWTVYHGDESSHKLEEKPKALQLIKRMWSNQAETKCFDFQNKPFGTCDKLMINFSIHFLLSH